LPIIRHQDNDLLITELPPIRRRAVLEHLQSLSPGDRRLRFGFNPSDGALRRYVASIDFNRDAVFGVMDDELRLIGLGHLALCDGPAEFGLSVLPSARGHGIGHRLLRRAAVHARAFGAPRLVMNYLPENTALRQLAKRAGMTLTVAAEGPTASLDLPPAPPEAMFQEAMDAVLTAFDVGFREAARRATSA